MYTGTGYERNGTVFRYQLPESILQIYIWKIDRKSRKEGTFCLDKSTGSEFFPGPFEEEKAEQWEDLQSSGQHVERPEHTWRR